MLCLRLFPRLASFASCLCLLAGLLLTSCSTSNTTILHATPTATPASTVSLNVTSTVVSSLHQSQLHWLHLRGIVP